MPAAGLQTPDELTMTNERDRLLTLYRERVAGYAEVGDTFHDDWLTWCRKVLAHGGDLVVPPLQPEPDLDRLLEDGTLLGPAARSLEQDGSCHSQIAKLWLDDDIAAIGTGYALCDGLWRQHSWGVGHDGAALEAKWACERYIGLTLPQGEPTVLFVLNNYDGDIQDVLREGTGRAREIIDVLKAARERRTESGRRKE